jgi:bla regulator protein BlaR1
MISFQLFSNATAEALGWTLLHSLWQVFIVFVVILSAFRFFKNLSSQSRYSIACFGMVLSVIAITATFYRLLSAPTLYNSVSHIENTIVPSYITHSASSPFSFYTFIEQCVDFINSNISFIISAWIIGTFIFLLRLLREWSYLSTLKKNATILQNEWNIALENLSHQLHLDNVVQLAESSQIDVPLVIGYIKPFILIPTGMLSGLSTEQLEAIFLHELAHIKRHDYIVNFIQSIVEALLFFNPFIWMISNIVNREREYCCDDIVVNRNTSALAYAKALACLEETRLSKNLLALSLAENKNQLLTRIKRIMKNSTKTYSVRDRIMPAALVIIGLACASWLTIQNEQQATPSIAEKIVIDSDTTIKQNKKSVHFSRKKITTTNEDGSPREETIETFEEDEVPSPLTELHTNFPLPVAPHPLMAIPPIADIDPTIPFAPFSATEDSLPGRHWKNKKDWEAFNKEFEQKFKERFGEFYNEHGKDLEKMMEELSERFERKVNSTEWHELSEPALAPVDLERIHAQIASIKVPAMRAIEAAQAQIAHQEAMKHIQESQKAIEHQLHEMNKNLKAMENSRQAFEKNLTEELIKDGYFKKNEKLKNIYWNDDTIKINGKKIKDKDMKKYRDLNEKHFMHHPKKVHRVQ